MVAMNENDLTIMGKKVSDMYGSRVGKAIGTTTDIDGTVISVGVDCGYRGLLEVPYEHLVVQEDSIIYIPQWRLDSQKVLRMKGLIIRRLRALNAILSDNDQLKDDSEAVLQGYEERLASVNESEGSIRGVLTERVEELDKQSKVAKSLLFDATIQYKSSEIHETDYKVVKSTTAAILERIDYETSEIKNMERRLDDLSAEENEVFDKIPHPEPAMEEENAPAESAFQSEPQAEATASETSEVPTEPAHEEPVTIPPEVPAEATYAPAEAAYAPSEVPTEPAHEEPVTIPPEVPAEATYAPAEAAYAPSEVLTEPAHEEPVTIPPEVPAEATYAPAEAAYAPSEVPTEPAHEEPVTIPPEVPAEATYAPAEAAYAPSEVLTEPAHEEPVTIPPEVPAEATYAPAEAAYAPSEVLTEPAHEEPVTIPPEVPAEATYAPAEAADIPPEVPTEQPASVPTPEYPIPEPPQTTSEPQKSDWLARMNSQ